MRKRRSRPSESLDADLAGRVQELTVRVEQLTHRIAEQELELERSRRQTAEGRDGYERDLMLACRIQASLLPRTLPHSDGWRMAAAYQAAQQVGGDFYDIFELPQRPGCLGIVMADVTGKGVAAALMMAFGRAVLRSASYNGRGPADALERANHVFTIDVPTGLFLTAVVAELCAERGSVHWASGGHEPPLLLRAASSRVALLPHAAPMVGMFAPLGAADQSVPLRPGDRLVLWTDGVTDACARTGRRFGLRRFRDTLRATTGATAQGTVDAVLAAVHDFAGDEPAADDLTLLVIERTAGDSA